MADQEQKSPDEKQQIVQAIKKAQHILIVVSQRSTGDQIGSLLALAEGLKSKGKKIALVSPDPIKDQYQFLAGTNELSRQLEGSKEFILEIGQNQAKAENLGYKIENDKLKITITPEEGNFTAQDVQFSYGNYRYDLIITLGVRELNQIGEIYQADPEIFYRTKTINLDNNLKNKLYGELNWIDDQASSLAEIMVSLLESLEISISKSMATSLLTALMTATDRFQSTGTSAKALTVAAQLTGLGADRNKIVQSIFQTTPYLQLKSWGRIVENLAIDPHLKLAWSVITKEEISRLGMNQESINQALEKLIATVQEAEIIALIQEEEYGAKVSLRSKGEIDVSQIAKQYRGGGRPNSAGFQIKGDDFPVLKRKIIRVLKRHQKQAG